MAVFVDPDASYYKYNYYIKGDRAYTEDNVLVFKLFVYKIPRKATTTDLQNYFSNYGKLLNVNFIPDKRRYKGSTLPKVAFVHFKSPEAAAAALKAERHYLLFKRILLKSCDSWHQPGAMCNSQKKRTEDKMVSDSVSSSSVGRREDVFADDSILTLNDYCLENIIKRLNLRDQVRFARTCTRFRQVFEMTSKVLHKNLALDRLNGMTLWEIRDYFDLAGECIVRINGELPEKYRERIVEFIGSFCKGVKHLDLETSDLRTKTLNKLIYGLPNIVDLRLHYCSLIDPAVLAIRKLRNLKTLNLSYNFYLTGKHINNLSPSIETLSLNNCNALLGKHVVSLCKSLTNLRELDLEQCYCLSTSVYESMISTCKNLEVLKISTNHTEYEMVARLPKLKNLIIYTNSTNAAIRDGLFNQLVEHKATQLEYLHIVGLNCINDRIIEKISRLSALRTLICPNNDDLTESGLQYLCSLKHLQELILKDCCNVSNTALLRLALACPELKCIHIQRCVTITDNLIFELIQKMRNQIQNKTFQRKEPISFMVENTKINEYILNDPEYVAAADLVRIYFNNAPQDFLEYDDFFGDHVYIDHEFDYDFEPAVVIDYFHEDDDYDDIFDNDFNFSDDEDDYDDEDDLWQNGNIDNIFQDRNPNNL